MRRPKVIRNGWYAARYLLGSTRATFPLLRLAPAPRDRVMVAADTGICIEGFPRSANTLAVLAVRARNPGVPIAHHMHVPAQVDRAVRNGVPTAVLVREPIEAIASLILFADQQLSARLALRTYIHYHRRIAAASAAVALCGFDEVVADPTLVARRLNSRFGLELASAPLDDSELAQLRDSIERLHQHERHAPESITVPSEYKQTRKAGIRARLESEQLAAEARRVYAELQPKSSAGG